MVVEEKVLAPTKCEFKEADAVPLHSNDPATHGFNSYVGLVFHPTIVDTMVHCTDRGTLTCWSNFLGLIGNLTILELGVPRNIELDGSLIVDGKRVSRLIYFSILPVCTGDMVYVKFDESFTLHASPCTIDK